MNRFPLTVLLCAVAASAAAAQHPADCARLRQLKLSQAQIDSAVPVYEGDLLTLWRGGPPQAMPRAFCRVRGTATPVKGSRIGFEVWLPTSGRWNGKFMQAGNGGTAGAVPLGSLLDGVIRGYAAAATDGGHEWPDGLDYGWAVDQPERIVDFGWRAVQRTTAAAKRIVTAGYGRAPKKSYFVGCSDGGRDAMMAVQRFPNDWDGIVSGAPALGWLGLMIGGALLQRELAPPAAALPVAKLPALQAAALVACGDGKAYVPSPLQCVFDPVVLKCIGAEADSCLTQSQVDAARKAYAGVTDASGRHLAGLSMGAEAEPGNWDFWLLRSPTNPIGGALPKPGDAPPTSINESFFRHLVRADPDFLLADLRDADVVQARQRYSATLDATDPDLRAFKARGGKLLHYHGWADSAIPPRMSLAYHEAVQRRMGPTADFYRLVMVPGMNHCAGGAGPWQVDWLAALERWVEAGQPPEALTARHPKSGETQVLRPHLASKDQP